MMPFFFSFLFFLLFRSNTDKDDNTEDKLDGLQKQVVSHMYCIGNPHDLPYEERKPHLSSALGELDCIALSPTFYYKNCQHTDYIVLSF